MSGKLKPSIVRLPVCALSGLIAVSLVLGPAARAIADPIGVTSGVYACAGAECNVSLTGGDGFFVNGGRSPSQFPIFFALQVGSVTKVQTDITTSLCLVIRRIQSIILGDLPACAPITTIPGCGASSKV